MHESEDLIDYVLVSHDNESFQQALMRLRAFYTTTNPRAKYQRRDINYVLARQSQFSKFKEYNQHLVELIRVMHKEYGFSVEGDGFDDSPLAQALSFNNVPLVEVLLHECDAHFDERTDHTGLLVDLVRDYGNDSGGMLHLLATSRRPLPPFVLRQVNWALHEAVMQNADLVVEILLRSPAFGADRNAKDFMRHEPIYHVDEGVEYAISNLERDEEEAMARGERIRTLLSSEANLHTVLMGARGGRPGTGGPLPWLSNDVLDIIFKHTRAMDRRATIT